MFKARVQGAGGDRIKKQLWACEPMRVQCPVTKPKSKQKKKKKERGKDNRHAKSVLLHLRASRMFSRKIVGNS